GWLAAGAGGAFEAVAVDVAGEVADESGGLHAEGGGGELGVQVGDELGDPGLPAQRRRGARGPEDPGEVGLVRPEYFEALYEDCSYQLTVIGKSAQAIIAEEIQDNRFAV